MADLTPHYDDRATGAVKSVPVEIAQTIGSFREKFAVIGGAVPWLRLDNPDMRHVGTLDVDLALHAEALGDGEYATLIEALKKNGYRQSQDHRPFQLVRRVPAPDGGPPIDVVVNFLMPRGVDIEPHKPLLLPYFNVVRADGVDLALLFNDIVMVEASMPDGGRNRVEVAVCTIPALIAMKGHALRGRNEQKDAYDVYYSIRNYDGGPDALAVACRPLLEHESALNGYRIVAEKFETLEGYGPTCVRRFVEETQVLDDRTPEQWQMDAFGQVDAWCRALGLRN
ncbi:nucleotidyl transferase AbiEii/AbiGii toxin family protein [Roseospira goensis]|uniref:Nucleotidyl transferase AbiEii/AbiGii toxin family protein n=1 Tax=Roseospira goensis TaxID=391922 RepID=A0A7W6WKB7_9PROT|nr:nucleotidyl transferase AbiEii/AbiGii toxin family protein [Roseospira goensis]MBB4285418.1 hypothetical protein [Roseospira goensis]